MARTTRSNGSAAVMRRYVRLPRRRGSPLRRSIAPARPTTTPLYRVVQYHVNTFLVRRERETGRAVPTWTGKESRQYLTCGIPARGFARIRCGDCRPERRLAFSCKGRGVCPSCANRRMAEVSAHLRRRVSTTAWTQGKATSTPSECRRSRACVWGARPGAAEAAPPPPNLLRAHSLGGIDAGSPPRRKPRGGQGRQPQDEDSDAKAR